MDKYLTLLFEKINYLSVLFIQNFIKQRCNGRKKKRKIRIKKKKGGNQTLKKQRIKYEI